MMAREEARRTGDEMALKERIVFCEREICRG